MWAQRTGTMVPMMAGPALDDTPGKLAVVGAYGFMILSNVLSYSGIFGSNIAEISQRYPTYLTPDGLTFSIWGVIYLLQLVLTIAQFFPTPDAERLFGFGVRYRIAAAFVLNGLWLPVYSAEQFVLALVIIIAYLALLVSAVLVINGRTVENMLQYFLYAAPLSANASWLVVATAANFFTAAGETGWKDAQGVAGTVPAAIIVAVLVTALASTLAVAVSDLAWSFVAAWAFRGLFRMHTFASVSFPTQSMSSTLATAANYCVAVALIAAYAGLAVALCATYQGLRPNYQDTCPPQAAPFASAGPMQSFA